MIFTLQRIVIRLYDLKRRHITRRFLMAPPQGGTGTIPTSEQMSHRLLMTSSVNWGWLLTFGIAMLVLGFITIGIPFVASIFIELFIGWMLTIGGIMMVCQAFTLRRSDAFWSSGLLGLLALVAGMFLLVEPIRGLFAITVLLAVYFFVDGVCKFAWGSQVSVRVPKGWIYFSAAVSIALGILIWLLLPHDVPWILGLLVGINLLMNGIAAIILSLTMHDLSEHEQMILDQKLNRCCEGSGESQHHEENQE